MSSTLQELAKSSALAKRMAVQDPVTRPSAVKGKAGKAGIEWIFIPGGNFLMGSEIGDPDEKPSHRVTVADFEMAKTLVTVKQYRACVEVGACTRPAPCAAKFNGDDQPVVCVDFNQAQAFSAWAGGRLPSEAQWQYAARSGGKDREFPWGNEQATCARAVMENEDGYGCGRDTTWPVCSKPAGNTDQGLCDMAGNVWQFTADWYHGTYKGAPHDGSAWTIKAESTVVRCGGAWRTDFSYLRAATRGNWLPDRQDDYHGFRPVRTSR